MTYIPFDITLVTSEQMKCPIPGCVQEGGDSAANQCICPQKIPLSNCPHCGMLCPANARFCRACRYDLLSAQPINRMTTKLTGPEYLSIPGLFHRAPVAAAGFLWALSSEGIVYRLSPCPGAVQFNWARVPSALAGWSSFAVVDVRAPRSPFQGAALIAGDRSTIYAVSLVDQSVHVLYQPGVEKELVFNNSVEESSAYAGVAANSDLFAFLTRAIGQLGAKLAVRYFNPERAVDEPFLLAGSRFVGPVVSGQSVAVCGEDEMRIFNASASTTLSFALPEGFEPCFQRPSRGFNVPPGHTPFCIDTTSENPIAYIAGELRGAAVLLEAEMTGTRSKPHPIPPGSCLSEAFGGLCLNRVSGIQCFGIPAPPGRITNLYPGMPVGYDSAAFSYFRQSTDQGAMELTALFKGSEPLSATFADAACNEDTCRAVHRINGRILVSYLQLPTQRDASRGLKFAHWKAE